MVSNEIVTSKTIVNTVKYHYNSSGKITKKVITPAVGSAQTIYYETAYDDSTIIKFHAGGRCVTSHSKNDSFGRKVFDELQLGTDSVSRNFNYQVGEVPNEHRIYEKVKSHATTNLVSHIAISNGTNYYYGYDAEQRITSVIEVYMDGETAVNNTILYTYDALGQLLTETVNGEVVNSMEYDNYGNIIKKNDKVYTYGDSAWKDLLTGFDGKTISYDAQGNPVNYLGHTLTWEKGRQLKRFVKSDGTVIDYTYNANGIRTSKTVGGVKHTYILDGTKILRETWGDNTLVPIYDNEDSVCGILYNEEPYYFIKNLQCDVIAIVNKDAQTVARYSYDAWGTCTVTQDTSDCQIATINPYRYRGYYYDVETELYYLQSRYYDASVGRFVNGDDIVILLNITKVIEKNIISYCFCDPLNNVDYTGYFSLPRGVVSMSIDILLWKYAGPFAAVWGWQTAPIKFMSKKMVEQWFKDKFVPVVVRGFINKALTLIRKIMWDLFKLALSGSISASINLFLSFAIWEHIDVILSAGGFVAGFLDYITDGKLDKNIKIW